MHVLSYPLAATTAWAATRFAPGHPSTVSAPGGLTAAAIALFALVGAWLAVNTAAHRWSLIKASGQLAASSEWVDWVVARLLERATPRDRRGSAAIVPVAMQLLNSDRAGSRVARFALDRMGASAITRVARALGAVSIGDAPISARVHQSLAVGFRDDSRKAGLAVASLVGLLVTFAIAALVLVHGE